jgi:hypothetical protein
MITLTLVIILVVRRALPAAPRWLIDSIEPMRREVAVGLTRELLRRRVQQGWCVWRGRRAASEYNSQA